MQVTSTLGPTFGGMLIVISGAGAVHKPVSVWSRYTANAVAVGVGAGLP